MATQYPNNIDTTGTLPYVVNGVSPVVADDVNRLRDTLVAIESELGASPSGVSTTVADRLDAFEASITLFAPDSATYFVLSSNVSLSNERIFTVGQGLEATDAGAGGAFTVGLTQTGVVAGAYTQPAFVVDGYGRIVSVNEGTFSSAAGTYALANVEIDGYGRIVAIEAGATDGYAGKLAYWQSSSLLTYDGYIDISAGKLVFSEDLYFGLYRTGETILGSLVLPVDYAVMESDSPLLISSNSNDGLLIGSNVRGVVGSNSDPWVIQTFDGNRTVVGNKSSGSNIGISSPNASMLDTATPFSFGVAGQVALASGTSNDGYGTAIESEENLAITGLGRKTLILSNNSSATTASVVIGVINGDGPTASSNWEDRYGDAAAHVAPVATFVKYGTGEGQILASPGTPSGAYTNPVYSFSTDLDTGMYSNNSDNIGFSTNGVPRLYISNAAVYSLAGGSFHMSTDVGTSGTPTYSFVDDANTGMYNAGTDQIGFAAGGTAAAQVDAYGVRTVSGSTAAPSYSFLTDADTGVFAQASDTIGFSAGGTLRATISNIELAATVPFRGAAGNSSAPTFSFTDDTDTGIYNEASNVIGFSVAGDLALSITSSEIISDIPALTFSAASPVIESTVGSLSVLATDTDLILRAAQNLTIATTGDGYIETSCGGHNILNISAEYIASTRSVSLPSIIRESGFDVGSGLDGLSGIIVDAHVISQVYWLPSLTFAGATLYIDNFKIGMKFDAIIGFGSGSNTLQIRARGDAISAYQSVFFTPTAVSSFVMASDHYYRFSIHKFAEDIVWASA